MNYTGSLLRAVEVGQDPDGTYTNEGVSGVDSGNSSTTNLTTGTSLIYTGTWKMVSGYVGIITSVDGTASGTVGGTLQMQFSHDGSTVHRDISVTNTDVTNVPSRTLGVIAKYFRIIYTADSDLTSFNMQTMFHTEQVSLVGRLDQTLQGNEDVANVRAALFGQKPDNTYENVQISDASELFTTTEAANKAHRIQYKTGTITGDTYIILADLSDTTGFPHSDTGSLNIDSVDFSVNFVSNNAEMELEIGVITRIDGTDSDISYLIVEEFTAANAKDGQTFTDNFQPARVDFKVSGGNLVNAITNITESSVTAVNTGITLDSPNGNIVPGLGDIIVKLNHITSNFVCTIGAIYHSRA